MENINYCKHVLTNEQILVNEMRLAQFLEMDQYHILLESGEIKTPYDKIECIRYGIESYCDSYEPVTGVDKFLKEFKDLIGTAEETRYELFEIYLEGDTQTLDFDQDLQALIGRNFSQIAFNSYADGVTYQIDQWSGTFNHGAVDLTFWCLDYFLMESALISQELREQILDTYRMQEEEE